MVGTRKRPAEDGSTQNARSAKVAKTSPPKNGKAGKGAKSVPPAASFKAKALPIHVNLTHTPPSIPDDDSVPATSADPGFLGAVTLVPSSFNTGSYGWKGSKRITVELQNPEGGEDGEKVQVMLTINATVLGSKNAKGEAAEDNPEEAAPETEATEQVADKEVKADGAEEAGEEATTEA
ncbi:hypothetical protein ONZ45_g15121 [Pleurotus djamor]|nr:hypothetical protein ONZ45_g15121 [Pleurotus djamor]